MVNANNSDAAFPHLVIKETDGEGYVALGSVEHPYSQLIEELKSECTIPLSEHEKSRAEDIDSLPWKWIDTNDQLADLVAVLQVCGEMRNICLRCVMTVPITRDENSVARAMKPYSV